VTAGTKEQDRGVGGTSPRAAAWLAWSIGILCILLLVLSLLFAALNGFATLMTPNLPEGGFGFRLADAIVSASFPQAGISSTYLLIFNLVFAATFTPVGVLVAWRQPSNSIGWLFCAVGTSAGVLVFVDQYAVYALLTHAGSLPAGAAAAWLESWVWLPATVSIFTLLPLLFPDGRPPTRQWRIVGWLAVIGMAMMIVSLALSPGPISEQLSAVENPLGVRGSSSILKAWFGVALLILWACVLASAASLILRLHRSEGQVRQQIKWFVYTAAMGTLALVAGTLIRGAASIDAAGTVLQFVTLPLLPIAVAVAILKYRLYDIDLIINRTLVYGSLTATLAAVYLGSVTATQALLRSLTSQEQLPQLVVVASTLLIAALFNPLRRRIQAFIDRRFYRSKYDARKTLEAFSVKLRDETDLEALRGDLVGVVRETMQPAHVSLWLRPETAWKDRQTT
jgi:hypothetical protein